MLKIGDMVKIKEFHHPKGSSGTVIYCKDCLNNQNRVKDICPLSILCDNEEMVFSPIQEIKESISTRHSEEITLYRVQDCWIQENNLELTNNTCPYSPEDLKKHNTKPESTHCIYCKILLKNPIPTSPIYKHCPKCEP